MVKEESRVTTYMIHNVAAANHPHLLAALRVGIDASAGVVWQTVQNEGLRAALRHYAAESSGIVRRRVTLVPLAAAEI